MVNHLSFHRRDHVEGGIGRNAEGVTWGQFFNTNSIRLVFCHQWCNMRFVLLLLILFVLDEHGRDRALSVNLYLK